MIHKLRNLFNRNRCCCETKITEQQLEKIMQEGAILLDVRSPQEFAEGHLKNAISLPEYEIKEKTFDMIPNKLQNIIVYCSTGHRSKKAQKTLKEMGYKKVYNLCNELENL